MDLPHLRSCKTQRPLLAVGRDGMSDRTRPACSFAHQAAWLACNGKLQILTETLAAGLQPGNGKMVNHADVDASDLAIFPFNSKQDSI
jgi:hypothetical protein